MLLRVAEKHALCRRDTATIRSATILQFVSTETPSHNRSTWGIGMITCFSATRRSMAPTFRAIRAAAVRGPRGRRVRGRGGSGKPSSSTEQPVDAPRDLVRCSPRITIRPTLAISPRVHHRTHHANDCLCVPGPINPFPLKGKNTCPDLIPTEGHRHILSLPRRPHKPPPPLDIRHRNPSAAHLLRTQQYTLAREPRPRNDCRGRSAFADASAVQLRIDPSAAAS